MKREVTRKFRKREREQEKYVKKLEGKVEELLQREYYNNEVVYRLRTGEEDLGIPKIDVDLLYGKIFGIEGVGGNGYHKSYESELESGESGDGMSSVRDPRYDEE